MPNPMLLTVDKLSASYGSIQVLHQIDLQVEQGQFVCVLGANGAGKTSLMRSLSGLMERTQGSADFLGHHLLAMSAEDIVKSGVAHVPQGRMVFSSLSVLDNLKLGGFTRPAREVLQDIDRILGYFPRLKERISQRAGNLSGGEQQLLAIGRGLLSKPKLLLLDEPSMGVAPMMKEFIFEKLGEIRKAENLGILLVEQDAALALQVADRGYVMETGRIVLQGSCDELIRSDLVQQAYLSNED